MQELPLRITPHALLETLVEVHYTARTHPELALGAFHNAVQPEYAYARPVQQLLEGLLAIQQQQEPVFQGEQVQFRVRTGSLAFTTVGEYPGWAAYFGQIQHIVTRLFATGEIAAFSRVGVRYVNALPGVLLNERLRVRLPQLDPTLPTSAASTFYQATFQEPPERRLVLTLADQQQVIGRAGLHALFDVDVIIDAPPTNHLSALFTRIDDAHTREKQVFFGLLDPHYLQSLQPEYPATSPEASSLSS